MIKGLEVRNIIVNTDERGLFSELFRQDWFNEQIVQCNLSYSLPGVVRAWHRHERGQVDYMIVLKGAMAIMIWDEEDKKEVHIENTEDDMFPKLVRVPGEYWHGVKVLGDEPAILLYFVTKLYDYDNPDELRKPYP